MFFFLRSQKLAIRTAAVFLTVAFFFSNINNVSADVLYKLSPPSSFTGMVDAGGTTPDLFRHSVGFRYISSLIGKYMSLEVSAHTIKNHIREHVSEEDMVLLREKDPFLAGVDIEGSSYLADGKIYNVPIFREGKHVFNYRYYTNLEIDPSPDWTIPLESKAKVYVKFEAVPTEETFDGIRVSGLMDGGTVEQGRTDGSLKEMLQEEISKQKVLPAKEGLLLLREMVVKKLWEKENDPSARPVLVFICGQPGTGKTTIAEALHAGIFGLKEHELMCFSDDAADETYSYYTHAFNKTLFPENKLIIIEGYYTVPDLADHLCPDLIVEITAEDKERRERIIKRSEIFKHSRHYAPGIADLKRIPYENIDFIIDSSGFDHKSVGRIFLEAGDVLREEGRWIAEKNEEMSFGDFLPIQEQPGRLVPELWENLEINEIKFEDGSSIFIGIDPMTGDVEREEVVHFTRDIDAAGGKRLQERRVYGKGHHLEKVIYYGPDGEIEDIETVNDFDMFKDQAAKWMDMNPFVARQLIEAEIKRRKERALSDTEKSEITRFLEAVFLGDILPYVYRNKYASGYPLLCTDSSEHIYREIKKYGFDPRIVWYGYHVVVEIDLADIPFVIDGTAGQFEIRSMKGKYHVKSRRDPFRHPGLVIMPRDAVWSFKGPSGQNEDLGTRPSPANAWMEIINAIAKLYEHVARGIAEWWREQRYIGIIAPGCILGSKGKVPTSMRPVGGDGLLDVSESEIPQEDISILLREYNLHSSVSEEIKLSMYDFETLERMGRLGKNHGYRTLSGEEIAVLKAVFSGLDVRTIAASDLGNWKGYLKSVMIKIGATTVSDLPGAWKIYAQERTRSERDKKNRARKREKEKPIEIAKRLGIWEEHFFDLEAVRSITEEVAPGLIRKGGIAVNVKVCDRVSNEDHAKINSRLHSEVKKGNRAAYEFMTELNIPLVERIVDLYIRRNPEFSSYRGDLVAAGSYGFTGSVQYGVKAGGLVRAIELYDPFRGAVFSTYASIWINREVRRAIQHYTDNREVSMEEPSHREEHGRSLADMLAVDEERNPDNVFVAKMQRDEFFAAVRGIAKKLGITNRDLDIFIFVTVCDDTLEETGLRYQLGRERVRQINDRVTSLLIWAGEVGLFEEYPYPAEMLENFRKRKSKTVEEDTTQPLREGDERDNFSIECSWGKEKTEIFSDTIKLACDKAKNARPVRIALGTNWIKGYETGKYQQMALAPLIDQMKSFCKKMDISLVVASDDKLLDEIKIDSDKQAKIAKGTGKEYVEAETIVIADHSSVISNKFRAFRDEKKAFLVGVNGKELTERSYVRVVEILTLALNLRFSSIFTANPGNNPNIGLFKDKEIFILLPKATKIYSPDELMAIYKVQLSA